MYANFIETTYFLFRFSFLVSKKLDSRLKYYRYKKILLQKSLLDQLLEIFQSATWRHLFRNIFSGCNSNFQNNNIICNIILLFLYCSQKNEKFVWWYVFSSSLTTLRLNWKKAIKYLPGSVWMWHKITLVSNTSLLSTIDTTSIYTFIWYGR